MRRPALLIGVAFLLACASPVAASPETAMAPYERGVRLPRRAAEVETPRCSLFWAYGMLGSGRAAEPGRDAPWYRETVANDDEDAQKRLKELQ